jgi:chemotaxis regulatin CheY-phosphate phosphatase CheZ
MLQHVAAAASLLLLLVAMAPSAATAQQAVPSSAHAAPSDDEGPRWAKTFTRQAKTLLNEGNTDMKARAMQLIIEFSERQEPAIDFSTLRPQLYDILLNQDNDDDLRILALSSLNATGPSPSVQVLAQSARDEASPRVRRFMLLTLQAQQK